MRIGQDSRLMKQEFQMKIQQKNNKEKEFLDNINPKKEEKTYNNGDAAMMDLFAESMKQKTKTEEIASKIAKGEALTREELEYIEEKNPELLRKAKTVCKQREELEKTVKKAKSKEEAIKIVQSAKMAIINGIDFKNEANIDVVKLQFEAIREVEKDVNERRLDKLV